MGHRFRSLGSDCWLVGLCPVGVTRHDAPRLGRSLALPQPYPSPGYGMWPERPERVYGDERTPLELVLGSVEALIIEVIGSVSMCLGLHRLHESLQIIVRRRDILRRQTTFILHSLHSVIDPGLKKELTGCVNLQRPQRFENSLPKLLIQLYGRHSQ